MWDTILIIHYYPNGVVAYDTHILTSLSCTSGNLQPSLTYKNKKGNKNQVFALTQEKSKVVHISCYNQGAHQETGGAWIYSFRISQSSPALYNHSSLVAVLQRLNFWSVENISTGNAVNQPYGMRAEPLSTRRIQHLG